MSRDAVPSARGGLDLSVAVPLAIVHVLGLGLAPFTFTPAGLAALVVMYHVTGFGVTAGAHRLFTHRSYDAGPFLRNALAIAFLLSAQGSLERWVRDHGIHHRFADAPGDPHSPRGAGFFFAHVGWLWKKPPTKDEARQLYARWTKGLDAGAAGRFFRSGGRLAALHVGLVAMAFGLGWLLEGPRTGVSMVVWGVLLRIVLVMHSTFFVNSATHLWGSRRYETRDDSRNLAWVAVVALGEGWHNNHHGRPSAANNGFHAWWELDPTFALVVAAGWLGLAGNVKVWRPALGRTEIWFRRREAAPEAEETLETV